MLRKMFAPLLAAGLVAVTVTAQSPEKIDAAMNAKIRAEGMDRSQIMRIEHMLTDVYGPRLTGSPNHENAGKWAIKEMESWGMKNGKMEPWNWGHEGWLNERADAHVTSPIRIEPHLRGAAVDALHEGPGHRAGRQPDPAERRACHVGSQRILQRRGPWRATRRRLLPDRRRPSSTRTSRRWRRR